MKIYSEGKDVSKLEKRYWWVGFEITCPQCSCHFELEEKDKEAIKRKMTLEVVRCPNGTCRADLIINPNDLMAKIWSVVLDY